MKAVFWPISVCLVLVAARVAVGETGDKGLPQAPPGYPGVFFGATRPVFLRLRFSVDGRPMDAEWKANVPRQFAYLDIDRDGRLSEAEFNRAAWRSPPVPEVFPSLTRAFRRLRGDDREAPSLDLEQFSREFAQQNNVVKTRGESAPLDRVDAGSQLWTQADLDHDGAITYEEMSRLGESVASFDADGNDLITIGELSRFANPFSIPNAQAGQPVADSPLAVATSPEVAAQIVTRLLATYVSPEKSTGAPSELRSGDIPVADAVIQQADGDKNGTVSTEEWTTFVQNPVAELEVEIHLVRPLATPMESPPNPNAPQAEVKWERHPEHGMADYRVLFAGPQAVVCEIGGVKWKTFVSTAYAASGNFYIEQFPLADTDNNKYIDRRESQRNGVYASAFASLDHDNDGKLFIEEVREYVARTQDDMHSRAEVVVRDEGRHLFTLLDTNSDRRLTKRELTVERATFQHWDRNGDGRLQQDELPTHYVANFGFGQATLGMINQPVPFMISPPVVGVPGPDWFHRLDRNQDGDVSAREFPGPLEMFAELDANHDGLIDVQEALCTRPDTRQSGGR